jgi:RNA polymerase sigma factor (sigma-70 family)
MVESLLARHIPKEDAEDAVQYAIEGLIRRGSDYGTMFAELSTHRGYFAKTALNAYLSLLRSERRRRSREQAHTEQIFFDVEDSNIEEVQRVLQAERLTELQRTYLLMIFDKHMSIHEIAEYTATSERAVRATLRRSIETIRAELSTANG